MSLDRCALFCNESAAVSVVGDVCSCLREALTVGSLDDCLCNFPCSGAESQLCGNPSTSRSSVFATPQNLPQHSFTVSGAGSREWNGVYRLGSWTGSRKGERERFDLDAEHSLFRLKGVWRLGTFNSFTAYHRAPLPPNLPHAAGKLGSSPCHHRVAVMLPHLPWSSTTEVTLRVVSALT